MTTPKFKGKYRIESTRLPNHDYTANGWYFLTICTKDRLHHFGQVISGQMELTEIGEIAQKFWLEIPNHFAHIHIDAYVIMPNHIHGIIVIDKPSPDNHIETGIDVETRNFASLQQQKTMDKSNKFGPLKSGSLQAIIHSYKSAITRWCRQNNHDNFAWQPRFYEHIIRADGSLDRIRKYIINNPVKWEQDKNNTHNLWM